MKTVETLIQSLQDGNESAFESLRGRLWYTLQSASGCLSLNPEWMQEAQLIMFSMAKIWDLKSSESFPACVYAKIKHEADHYLYHNYKRHHIKLDSYGAEVLEEQPEPTDPDLELDKAWVKERTLQLLQAHLDKVDLKIFIAYFYRNKTQEQIADKLHLDQSTVSRRMEIVLRKLRELPEWQLLWENSRHLF